MPTKGAPRALVEEHTVEPLPDYVSAQRGECLAQLVSRCDITTALPHSPPVLSGAFV